MSTIAAGRPGRETGVRLARRARGKARARTKDGRPGRAFATRAGGRGERGARRRAEKTRTRVLPPEAPDFFVRMSQRATELGEFNEAFLASFVTSACVGATAFMWERAWKGRVFGSDASDDASNRGGWASARAESADASWVGESRDFDGKTLHGVDVSRYAIFQEPEVKRALAFAASWHRGQRRKNGDSYAKHCVESAKILAANLPGNGSRSRDAVCACLLHDVLDDTACTDETLKATFGTRVYNLVIQVSRVGQMNEVMRRRRRDVDDVEVKAKLSEEDLTQLRKILLLIVRDPRVFLIKIADRLHNMRTIYAISSEEKAMDIANETLRVWCSLAEKLGMWAIKSELEDLCFAVLDPENFDGIMTARSKAWKPRAKDMSGRARSSSKSKQTGQTESSPSSFFGLDAVSFFGAKEETESDSFDGSGSHDDDRYAPWQLDVKHRIESIPSFDWLSTREGDSLQVEGLTALPGSIAASLSTLDAIRGRLWSELLMDGYTTQSDLNISVSSRLKSAYSTYMKMKRKNLPFERVCDTRAMRIVVGDASTSERGTEREIDACYALLDLIHKMYRPIEGEYDDYITNAKKTGYRSLHTAIGGPDGAPLEVQVRTRSMHDAAEFGVAAQWMYKGKPKFASKSYQDASHTDETPSVGGGVQLVSSGRRSCGVVIDANGSRMLVAEPMRSEWSDVAAWMADKHHEALMKEVIASGLTSARQGTSEFFISEFCYCVDQRWHRVDNLGHKTRVTAEIVIEGADDANDSDDDLSSLDDDDVDMRIRQLQTVAGELLNESIDGDDASGEDKETLLSNWSATAAEIEKRKRIARAKQTQLAREERWRRGEEEAPALNILMAGKRTTPKPSKGIFQTEEAAKFEAEVALKNPSAKLPNVDLNNDGVMVITWKDDLPEVRSVRRGSTVAEIRAEAASSADADARVNVNMVMVLPSTKLKDGDMIFLSSDGDTKAREHVS